MGVTIIFLPCSLYHAVNCFLYGVVQTSCNGTTIFYVLGHSEKQSHFESKLRLKYIGVFSSDSDSRSSYPIANSADYWLNLKLKNNEFLISNVTVNQINVFSDTKNVISIIFDPLVFQKSELLTSETRLQIGEPHIEDIDHVAVLTTLLRDLKQEAFNRNDAESALHNSFFKHLSLILMYLNIVLDALKKLFTIFKYSSLCSQFVYTLENITWCLSTYVTNRRVTLKVGNYLCGRLLDSVFGMLILYFLMGHFTNNDIFRMMANLSEGIVMQLRIIIQWLMGSPAGLKLNAPFTSLLGRFFLYHVNLWWSFLIVTGPMLEFMYTIFLQISLLGLSFQIAIVSDLLLIVSFHVYCVYVYAARLYNLQLTFLSVLFRLFIGRKRNPLPGQVDSHPYTTEQLFIGTLAFTVLLFLLPTTFVYYSMFATMRALLVAASGILARMIFFLQTLPVFVIHQWMFNNYRTTDSICLMPQRSDSQPALHVLYVTPITSSLWSIIKSTIPNTIKFPDEVDWAHTIKSLASGRLIYTI